MARTPAGSRRGPRNPWPGVGFGRARKRSVPQVDLTTVHVLSCNVTHKVGFVGGRCVRFRPTPFSRGDRLIVDDAGRGRSFTALMLPQHRTKMIPNRMPGAVDLELARNAVDRLAGRTAVSRQVAPGASGPQQIQDRVHRRTHVGLARTTTGRRIRDEASGTAHSPSVMPLGKPPPGRRYVLCRSSVPMPILLTRSPTLDRRPSSGADDARLCRRHARRRRRGSHRRGARPAGTGSRVEGVPRRFRTGRHRLRAGVIDRRGRHAGRA